MTISNEALEPANAKQEQIALQRLVEHAAEMAQEQGLLGAAYRLREAVSEIEKELRGTIFRV